MKYAYFMGLRRKMTLDEKILSGVFRKDAEKDVIRKDVESDLDNPKSQSTRLEVVEGSGQ